MTLNATDKQFLDAAIHQARIGWEEGGVPIGAGVEVIVADNPRCIALMEKMKTSRPALWAEDIGEDA